ncbi:hypothetical protein vseg_021112 [Gypsophila vaccaria]
MMRQDDDDDDLETLSLDQPSKSMSDSLPHHPLSSSSSSSSSTRVHPAVSHPLLSALPDDPDFDISITPFPDTDTDTDTNGIRDFEPDSESKSEYLSITVSNPQKEHDLSSNSIVPGGHTYVTYLITTRTNLPGFGGGDLSVRRRFRDFLTLADRLAEAYRGFFIPPRPDKSVVESQLLHKQEFVEQRCAVLHKYLAKLASHPVLRKSDELRVFLQVPGKLPLPTTTDVASRMLDGAAKFPKQLFGESRSVVAPHEAVQPAKGGRDLLRLFKELRQSVTNDWGNSKPPLVEEDNEFLDNKDKLHNFQLHLTEASKQAESLVKAQQDMGDTMGELGLSFIKLTKFENEAALSDTQRTRATEMKNIATAAVKGSRVYRELNAKTVKNLDTLHEYLGVSLAARNAYSERASALLTVQTLLSELSSLQLKLEKLEAASSKVFGGDKSSQKIAELKETIKITEDSKNCAIREYERIKENNRGELERLDKDKRVDFFNMLKGFVHDQVSCAEKMANLWSRVAEDTRGYAKEGS